MAISVHAVWQLVAAFTAQASLKKYEREDVQNKNKKFDMTSSKLKERKKWRNFDVTFKICGVKIMIEILFNR